MGEMARFFNAVLRIGAPLHVVPAAGWRRSMWFDETGLPWVRPSPNLPTLASAIVYPALVAVRGHERQRGARNAGRLPALRRTVAARRQRRRAAQRPRASGRALRARDLHAPRGDRRQVSDDSSAASGSSSPIATPVLTGTHQRRHCSGPSTDVARLARHSRDRHSTSGSADPRCERRSCAATIRTSSSRATRRGAGLVAHRGAISRSIGNLSRAGPRMCLARLPTRQHHRPPRSRTAVMISPQRSTIVVVALAVGLAVATACGPRQVEVRTAPRSRHPVRRRCS